MLADLIRRLTDDRSDMRVVAEVEGDAAVQETLERTHARFVIVGLREATLSRRFVPVLAHHPGTTLLGVTVEGQNAFLYELRPHAVPVGELSAELLVDLVQSAGRVN